jgi:hypothetical protein
MLAGIEILRNILPRKDGGKVYKFPINVNRETTFSTTMSVLVTNIEQCKKKVLEK